jgi:hypothetical protein
VPVSGWRNGGGWNRRSRRGAPGLGDARARVVVAGERPEWSDVGRHTAAGVGDDCRLGCFGLVVTGGSRRSPARWTPLAYEGGGRGNLRRWSLPGASCYERWEMLDSG